MTEPDDYTDDELASPECAAWRNGFLAGVNAAQDQLADHIRDMVASNDGHFRKIALGVLDALMIEYLAEEGWKSDQDETLIAEDIFASWRAYKHQSAIRR